MKKLLSLFIFLTLWLYSCSTGVPVVVEEAHPEPILPQVDFLTILAAGDNLYHSVMIRSGEGGDYKTAYEEIRYLVSPADIAFINQETLLAGEDFTFSGYPLFNTPQKVGTVLAETGFNVVNHATNHIMDKGEKAVLATLDFWDSIPGMTVLGIHRSQEQRDMGVLLKKNNITTGFLSYTYGTNSIPVPAAKPYLVSLVNTEIMAKEINALRPLCDILVVSMHWGEEYRHEPSKNQETLALFLAEHLVDLVIGHHPHVIQEIKYIPRPDGKETLCYYSLGNLLSAQTQPRTLLGALAHIGIKRVAFPDSKPLITIENAGAIPMVTHYEKSFTGFKIYPLYAYTEELAEKHYVNQNKKELTMEYLGSLSRRIFGEKETLRNPFIY